MASGGNDLNTSYDSTTTLLISNMPTNACIADTIHISTADQLIRDRFTIPGEVHQLCIPTILALTLLGNMFVIYSQLKKKITYNSDIYIFYLSVLDIVSCGLLVQFPLLPLYIRKALNGEPLLRVSYFMLVVSLIYTYFGILVCIALDRVLAIVRPYTYTHSRNRTVFVCSAVTFFCIVIGSVNPIYDEISATNGTYTRLVSAMYMSAAFIALIVSYIVIFYKLKRQKRRIHTINEFGLVRRGIVSHTKMR